MSSVSIFEPVKDPSPRSHSIAISVVVPVRDEEDSIRALLHGLLNQTLPPDEIVITDGGSADSTRSIIEDFIRNGAPVKLVVDDDSLPGRSRNIGVANARNPWIAFIDAGIRPAPNWLASLVEKVGDESRADVVYGTYEPMVDSFFKECAAIAYVPPMIVTESGWARPTSVASALMRRDVFQAVGGFPEDLRSAEDLLFMRKVRESSFTIVRAPEAVVHWNIQPNLLRTFRRFTEYARNNMKAGLWREWQAAIFVQYAGLAAVTALAVFFGPRWLAAPILLWLLLLVTRATRAVLRNRRCYPATLARNFARIITLVAIILTLDAASIVGSGKWLMFDWLRK